MITALVFMSIMNVHQINRQISETDFSLINNTEDLYFNLSRKGQNVVVIMLDMGISGYVPYIMEERPELKEKFSGFVYYPNTISFGMHTNFGAPALYGGYEYSPAAMNRTSFMSE